MMSDRSPEGLIDTMLRMLCVLLAATAAACSTVPDASVGSIEGGIPEGSGLVIAESITNGTRITGVIEKWNEIIFYPVAVQGNPEPIRVVSLDESFSTEVFAGAIPAGTYRLGMLRTFSRLGDTRYFADALVPPALGTFEVQPGAVTNLGTILYQPFQDRSVFEQTYPDYVITRASNEALWQTVALMRPELSKQIDAAKPILDWVSDSSADDRQRALQMILTAGIPRRVNTLSDGGLALNGLAGGLYTVRDGEFSSYELGTAYTIIDAAELSNGDLLVGGELGTLKVVSASSGQVRSLFTEGHNLHVLEIVAASDGRAYLLVLKNDQYEILQYDAASDNVSSLYLLPHSDTPRPWKRAIRRAIRDYTARGWHPQLMATETGLAVFHDGIIHRYNENDSEWSTSKSQDFIEVYKQQNGVVVAIPSDSWKGRGPSQYSLDDGMSWSSTEEKIGTWDLPGPVYRLLDGALFRTGSVANIRLFSADEILNEVPVEMSTDLGRTWEQVGTAPRNCTDIALESSEDERIIILCDDGRLISSQDRGRTWNEVSLRKVPEFDRFPPSLKTRYADKEEGLSRRMPAIPLSPTN